MCRVADCFADVTSDDTTRWWHFITPTMLALGSIAALFTLWFHLADGFHTASIARPTKISLGSPAFQYSNSEVPYSTSYLRSSRLGSSSTDTKYDEVCDVLVLGSGVAARSIASLLAAQDLSVVLTDQALDRSFVPNYGVWKNEWEAVRQRFEAMGVELDGGLAGSALDREWQVTDCYFGGSFGIPTDKRMRLDRPYCRVDKQALLQSLTTKKYKSLYANHFSRAIGVNLYEPSGSLVHDATGTTVQLKTKETDELLTIRSKLVVDCTGHETKLVLRETREPYLSPGFQIAYGILVDVEEDDPNSPNIGPYAKDAMTLFDYRTDHFDMFDKATQDKVSSSPTFMYGTFLALLTERALRVKRKFSPYHKLEYTRTLQSCH